VSKHLRVLREAGLVSSEKEGRLVVYRIEAQRLQEVFDWVQHFEQFWDEKLDALGKYLRQRHKHRVTGKSR
jgi:DNA-binding transcriptional ArsR family regulator